jgi:hypothetical protein
MTIDQKFIYLHIHRIRKSPKVMFTNHKYSSNKERKTEQVLIFINIIEKMQYLM